jgi:hypothetical protein
MQDDVEVAFQIKETGFFSYGMTLLTLPPLSLFAYFL